MVDATPKRMRIMMPEAPSPLIVSGALRRRWQRQNPSGTLPEFVQYLDDYYGEIQSECAQVTVEELLQRCFQCDQQREASASFVNPIFLTIPKPEPIELSSDSDTDVNPSNQHDTSDASSLAEGRHIIETWLLRRWLEVDQLASGIDELHRLATEASNRAVARLRQLDLSEQE